ncbi:MAG: nuclear transport factor 2 family protein [Pseudomonadota bacterium]
MRFAKWVLLALLASVPAGALAADHADDPKSAIVYEFLAAFNAQDATRMGAMVTEDIKWLSVSDATASIEVEGRSNLVAAMEGYFSSCPSCRSTISRMMPSRDRVSAIEVATWESEGGLKSQQSMAIYEFSGEKIAAVYYFPAESVSLPEGEIVSE